MIATCIGIAVVVIVALILLIRRRRRRRAARGHSDAGGRVDSLEQALSTADARLRQISDYVAKHRKAVGDQAQAQLEDAKRHLAAAHGKQASNEAEAIAYANRASVLAARAQELANADVVAAHRTPRR
ncbi:hypothetical protein Mkiyose1665_26470 [Mycobacterium kiyosense]|uniref:Uncharacterized protein n=1 Tax=Mycobacterium kiyosense TaxID=2871094 RepID=A0A9P3Q7B0_9MYCO|nr:hypothetical protein Mkiyose1413_18750 [Mycobacterium kiyosense]GLD35771.1 hypothetical protein Mkiyose1595_19910 [Mycobacterium kiyosense]GLD42147.1 hypothetical protein Mkiyose1665_26470 [Mycobacterium kiyosense]